MNGTGSSSNWQGSGFGANVHFSLDYIQTQIPSEVSINQVLKDTVLSLRRHVSTFGSAQPL